MVKITIDQREIEVPPGTTVLEAARRLGIEIPTLCHMEGIMPSTSCLVCMVKLRDRNRLTPSCATVVTEGMQVDSDTPEVHAVRRAALELILSDHVGDCLAPCHFACPCHMDIPLMLRQISAEHLRDAIVTIKHDIALPAVLGRVCPKPCEKGCRRHGADDAVSVCELKRYVADMDMASAHPYLPECKPATGKRVAIVGAGPTGLSAAFYLRRSGHACTLFEKQPKAGGRLRREASSEELPAAVLDGEIDLITRLGMEVRLGSAVGEGESTVASLRQNFDAVLLSCGGLAKTEVQKWGLQPAAHGIHVDKDSFQTSMPGVFAAGNAIRAHGLVVRSVADGKEVAHAIDQFLSGQPFSPPHKPFSSRIGKLAEGEIDVFVAAAGTASRQKPLGDFQALEACAQAERCLHCDCSGQHTCKLRRYAAQYGADPNHYKGPRREFRRLAQNSKVIYEPGKCIDCGLCIEIAARAGEPLGLSFVGRGFDVRVGVPFNRTMEEALSKVAAECIAACPTAALAFAPTCRGCELQVVGEHK